MVREIELNDVVIPPGECGTWAFMYRGKGLEQVRDWFHRDGIALKIHHQPLYSDLRDYDWGAHYLPEHERGSLLESITVQNVCAFYGLAPRVYGVVLWKDRFGHVRPCQVTDDLGRSDWSLPPEKAKALVNQIKELGVELGFTTSGDKKVHNVAGGKFVDFQAYRFTDDYEERLMERFWKGTMWGDRPYQSLMSGTDGVSRQSRERIAELGLLDLDFHPQRMLDIGCSGGMFLNELVPYYNARGFGYDRPDTIQAAREYSNYVQNWNTDYFGMDLHQDIVGNYDLVLFLNMTKHVGFPDYVLEVSGKRLIIEVHSEHEQMVRDKLSGDFEIVREQRSSDYGRLVIHAERQV